MKRRTTLHKRERVTTMKKVSLRAIVDYIVENDVTELSEIKDEIVAELAKDEVKAQANRDLYAQAKGIVMDALRLATAPVTIGELYDSIATKLPEGFSKGKVQYAVTRLWSDEIVKTEGKVNTYSLR